MIHFLKYHFVIGAEISNTGWKSRPFPFKDNAGKINGYNCLISILNLTYDGRNKNYGKR